MNTRIFTHIHNIIIAECIQKASSNTSHAIYANNNNNYIRKNKQNKIATIVMCGLYVCCSVKLTLKCIYLFIYFTHVFLFLCMFFFFRPPCIFFFFFYFCWLLAQIHTTYTHTHTNTHTNTNKCSRCQCL